MKKFKALCVATLASLMAFAPTTAFAQETEETGVSIQINGNDLEFSDAKPVIENGRVYVPFRAVFEGLKAEVSYDEATKSIVAQKSGTEVKFTIGNNKMTITKDGSSQTVDTDAASFVKNNRTYVPVRFAAQALDCKVGWDGNNKTAIIIENDLFAAKEGTTYEIMNKYLAFANEFSENTYALTGNLTLNISATDGEENTKIAGTCTIDGIVDSSKINMGMVADLDLSEVEAALKKEEAVDEETTDLLNSMKQIKMNMIMNTETGKFYVNSNIISKLLGAADNTWYAIDFNKFLDLSGVNFTFADIVKLSKTEDFGKYVESLSALVPTDNKYAVAAYVESFKMIEALFSDSAFKKSGNEYISSYTANQDGASSTMEFALILNGDKVEGYRMNMNVGLNGKEIMTVKSAQKGLDVTMDMNMNMEDMFEMNMTGGFKYSATKESPLAEPDKSSTIVDLSTMLGL